MNPKDLLDFDKVAKLEKKLEKFQEGKVAEKNVRYFKKLDKQDNEARLNNMGQPFNSLDFGGTEFED